MADPKPGAVSSIILFGSLALSFDGAALSKLRNRLADDSNKWLADIIRTLPQAFEAVAAALPSLHPSAVVLARMQLLDLNEALTIGRALGTPFPLPNSVLIPLVVAGQLLEYAQFMQQTSHEDDEMDAWANPAVGTQVLGLCTGLLSAFAAASAHSSEEFRRYSASAVRLGMLVGLIVDSQDVAQGLGRSRSLSTVWDRPEGREDMVGVVEQLSGVTAAPSTPNTRLEDARLGGQQRAYVSVHYDENRATITTSADHTSELIRRLQAAGINASEIGLYGRFHSAENADLVDQAMSFIGNTPGKGGDFELPDAALLRLPTLANDGSGTPLKDGALHVHALRAILLEPPRWFDTFSAAISPAVQEKGSVAQAQVDILDFGPDASVPPSLLFSRTNSSRTKLKMLEAKHLATGQRMQASPAHDRPWTDSDVAIVGMSCKVPGADNVSEFWDMLVAGESQHQEVGSGTEGRFSFADNPFRTSSDAGMKGRKWFANLVSGHDQFDHRFFRKSARESAAMDPQQRHMLQASYQAVEMSGYFQRAEPGRETGCFIGLCLCDYENNVACHPAGAFAATGNLQGFVSGKVSHFFGWTGPALTINTACSSSLVAVHQACRAIQSGECEAALAGGTHIMTSAEWFQNLAGGSFLSPSGQCKPFDSRADGYCRGEGVGAVFLKSMSRALADGDQILGVIAATAVQQTQNCTPVFVPNQPSLSHLFRKVVAQARVRPSQISVVEAHGTGTPVGDPVEYASIRSVLGGPNRGAAGAGPLMVSSVKGLVGHAECASGIISLIKVLLMMNRGVLPPQASFEIQKPALNAAPSDRMFIPTRPQPWEVPECGFRAALINNYGASGSNASAVILQPRSTSETATKIPSGAKHPFWLGGLDEKSLHRQARALRTYLDRSTKRTSIANISLKLARQSNRALDARLLLSAGSVDELKQTLSAVERGEATPDAAIQSPWACSTGAPAVVLVFGGQVSTHIGLDRQLYYSVALLRHHLNAVDGVVQSLGLPSIFPAIFERSSPAVVDTVQLQAMLFATQYAFARCWIDSGVQPAALVGHSFGELTALCVAGVLGLEDAVKMFTRRAAVVRDAWGDDKGAMMAVEADLADVEQLLADANDKHSLGPASIACYNGERSFTLAGPTAAIDAIASQLAMLHSRGQKKTIKHKRLDVTNAFHSVLVDPLLDSLKQCFQGLTFGKADIPIELATEKSEPETKFTANFLADHMRRPVHFYHAVSRLARRYYSSSSPPPSSNCVFLEAGTNSTVTSMAARALVKAEGAHTRTFHGLNVANCDDGWNRLTDATMGLWKSGLPVQHWAHHALQTRMDEYAKPLLLPPYQFDPAARHWLELKDLPVAPTAREDKKDDGTKRDEDKPEEPLIFCGWFHPQQQQHGQEEPAGKTARFRINTSTDKYKQLLAGHITIQTAPILSATLQMGFVIDAVTSIRPEYLADPARCQPQIQDVKYHSPVCANSARALWIDVADVAAEWQFEVFSTAASSPHHQAQDPSRAVHTTGSIALRSPDEPSLRRQFVPSERLFSHARVSALLQSDAAEEVLANRTIYRIFSEIVSYGPEFRGLQKMVVAGPGRGRGGSETAGQVVRLNHDPAMAHRFDAHLADTFCQLGGLWVNCMSDREPRYVYLANGIDSWIRAHPVDRQIDEFHVFAVHQPSSDKLSMTDVFVFDAADGTLVEVILGIAYVKIPKLSMEKLLARLTEPEWMTATSKTNISRRAMGIDSETMTLPSPAPPIALTPAHNSMGLDSNNIHQTVSPASKLPVPAQPTKPAVEAEPKPPPQKPNEHLMQNIKDKVMAVIVDLSGLELAEIKDDSHLADLGIDSLAGMEMVHQIESDLHVKLPEREIFMITDMAGLMKCVAGAAGVVMVDSQASYPDSDATTSSSSPSDAADTTTTTPSTRPNSHITEDSPRAPQLPISAVLEAFGETKHLTDCRITAMKQSNYSTEALPLQNSLAVALVLEAFEVLGAGILSARPGDRVPRIRHAPQHDRFVTHLYTMLQEETQIIKVDDGGRLITRTAVPLPSRSSAELAETCVAAHPDQGTTVRLTVYAGASLAKVLSGELEAVHLIFGCAEGRDLVGDWYANWPLNRVLISQMEDFLERIVSRFHASAESPGATLRILEMGAGTGGTTKRLLPLLAWLGAPVEYTFTDLAPSLVAAARKRWAAEYPWMRFRVHDIEREPEEDLVGSQHIVVASNAVHATKSLRRSSAAIHRFLRPDGFLVMMEMTRPLPWVDLVFGLFEGWWLFDDGRNHALAHEEKWDQELKAAGYGSVDWTEGQRQESEVQKVILATAAGLKHLDSRLERHQKLPRQISSADCAAREEVVAKYVRDMTQGFDEMLTQISSHDSVSKSPSLASPRGNCILVTGCTGGLGAHLVAEAALSPDVTRVICLNRPARGRDMSGSNRDPRERQMAALAKKGLHLPPGATAKIRLLETDLSSPQLGLSSADYHSLLGSVTHIIHNAWLMHSKWPVKRFEPQLRIMANMIRLAGDISAVRGPAVKSPVTFIFVSSIATVGHHPLHTGRPVVPEERVSIESVLPTGYGDAKYICERMLDRTLHRFPDRFRAAAARLGQIAGSSTNGHWNPAEHVSFLVKSSQTLGVLPELPGTLGWTPGDRIAATLVEIATLQGNVALHPIYHVDNPVRQPWAGAMAVLASAAGIHGGTVPLQEWLHRVREWPRREDNRPEGANPAYLLVDFLESNFVRMSCGGLLMGTARAREHSSTLARQGAVSDELIRMYVKSWKDMGVLV